MYLLSNFCVMVGMMLVAYKLGIASRKGRAAARNELVALNISSDTLILLAIGAVARLYWSFSPPGVWAHETASIQALGMIDVVVSGVVHIALLCLIAVIEFGDDSFFHGGASTDSVAELVVNVCQSVQNRNRPVYVQALPLAAGAFCVAAGLAHVGLEPFHHPGAFPLTDTFIVFNMTVDMVAMVPQILQLAGGAMMSDSRKSTETTTTFCALLSAARVLRLCFWLALYLLWGEAVTVFILPDVLHTILMGDFLYQWLMAVRRDAAQIL